MTLSSYWIYTSSPLRLMCCHSRVVQSSFLGGVDVLGELNPTLCKTVLACSAAIVPFRISTWANTSSQLFLSCYLCECKMLNMFDMGYFTCLWLLYTLPFYPHFSQWSSLLASRWEHLKRPTCTFRLTARFKDLGHWQAAWSRDNIN